MAYMPSELCIKSFEKLYSASFLPVTIMILKRLHLPSLSINIIADAEGFYKFPEGVLYKRLNVTTGFSTIEATRNVCADNFNSWLPVSVASNWSKVALKAIMQPADIFFIGIHRFNFWSGGFYFYTDEGE